MELVILRLFGCLFYAVCPFPPISHAQLEQTSRQLLPRFSSDGVFAVLDRHLFFFCLFIFVILLFFLLQSRIGELTPAPPAMCRHQQSATSAYGVYP